MMPKKVETAYKSVMDYINTNVPEEYRHAIAIKMGWLEHEIFDFAFRQEETMKEINHLCDCLDDRPTAKAGLKAYVDESNKQLREELGW